ncbi:MAG TPA: hypothetical protein VK743_05395 [Steroidobacteraceae bacterium]|nr:hypothetical protein [Steroidobacteraceae bacterium]
MSDSRSRILVSGRHCQVKDVTSTRQKTNLQLTRRRRKFIMEQAQLIQAAASIAGGMAAAHYDKFAGLVASRITEIAETAVKIAKAIEIEARKQP